MGFWRAFLKTKDKSIKTKVKNPLRTYTEEAQRDTELKKEKVKSKK
jgi:hypothetical protein